ncbi:MAG TPA: hypothetical protein VHG08_11975 [Longimicrobium sp.]|nr:hypothetical protein [Longimicrobium sp.]
MSPSLRHAPVAALLVLAACSADRGPGANLTGSDNPEGIVFLAETEAGNDMDALFEGRVIRDQAGCLRLQSAQPSTVIWPAGSRLESRGGALFVIARDGRALTKIGAETRLGGGHVPSHAYAELTPRDRELAETRCPGEYWIVG